MDEELAVTGVVDHAPRRRIDRLGGCVLSRGRVAGLLRAPDHVVDILFLAARCLADMNRARDIGAIAAHSPAEIEDDRVTLGASAIAGLLALSGTVGARPPAREP